MLDVKKMKSQRQAKDNTSDENIKSAGLSVGTESRTKRPLSLRIHSRYFSAWIKEISNKPGVYIFQRGKTSLYVGKATQLKKRVSSYWKKDAGPKIQSLLGEATGIQIIETESEIDALIKEAELIKKYYPKYNIVMRDDKNYFYVAITNPSFLTKTSGWQAKEDFPRIYLTHQPRNLQTTHYSLQTRYIGPFTSGSALKLTLRILRGIFPYCTCKEKHKRPCLNAEIGRCLGYCCLIATNSKEQMANHIEYKKNIQNIVAVLSGRRKKLLNELKTTMRKASTNQEYEKAATLRDQIYGIENILMHQSILNGSGKVLSHDHTSWNKVEQNLKQLFGLKKVTRAEGYDISNISGISATGSMVVFMNGRSDKSEYRKFSIKTVHGANDVEMHKEVMRRRLTHTEWTIPDLMVIDGGKPQLNAILSVLRSEFPALDICVVGLAKREEELYTRNTSRPIPLKTLPPETGFFFQRIRDESHRFAKKYHHKRREILYRNLNVKKN